MMPTPVQEITLVPNSDRRTLKQTIDYLRPCVDQETILGARNTVSHSPGPIMRPVFPCESCLPTMSSLRPKVQNIFTVMAASKIILPTASEYFGVPLVIPNTTTNLEPTIIPNSETGDSPSIQPSQSIYAKL